VKQALARAGIMKRLVHAARCELLGLNRSSVYYQPEPVSPDELVLMRRIDKIYTRCPFYGQVRITAQLNRDHDDHWNRKRIQRLMGIMGIRGCCAWAGYQ